MIKKMIISREVSSIKFRKVFQAAIAVMVR